MRNVVPIVGGGEAVGSPIFFYILLLLILPIIGLIAFALGVLIFALIAKGLWIVGKHYYLKWKKHRQRQLALKQSEPITYGQ